MKESELEKFKLQQIVMFPVGPGYRNNTADWLTRGRTPDQLNKESHWWNGPSVLYQPVENWGLKFGLQKEESLPTCYGKVSYCPSEQIVHPSDGIEC